MIKKIKDIDILRFLVPELKFKNFAELEQLKLRKDSNELNAIWQKSGQSDFSIYSDNRYLSEMIISWFYISKGSINCLVKYLKSVHDDISKLSFLDDYNGTGITTLQLARHGITNLTYFNDVELQRRELERLFKHFGFEIPLNVQELLLNEKQHTKKYDVVFSSEVVEHCKKPMEYIEEILERCKTYFVYSSGFRSSDFPGHFKEYIIDNTPVTGIQASKLVNKRILKEFSLVFSGWNCKPKIFKRN